MNIVPPISEVAPIWPGTKSAGASSMSGTWAALFLGTAPQTKQEL